MDDGSGPAVRIGANRGKVVLTFSTYRVQRGRIPLMDDIDRKILAELQEDGRLTITELAERVNLSVSPCHRRLRALERAGAIRGYRAHLDAAALGLTFEALVFVTMRGADRDRPGFEQAVADPQRRAGPTALRRTGLTSV
jgi:DNA-binding Lrp family transcriptional regulator